MHRCPQYIIAVASASDAAAAQLLWSLALHRLNTMTDAQLRRRIRAIKRIDKMEDFIVVCASCIISAGNGSLANSSSTVMHRHGSSADCRS